MLYFRDLEGTPKEKIKLPSGIRSLAALLVFLAVSFVIYRHAVADIVRRDHFLYIAERANTASDWDWFWHSVSWSRTRFLRAGDSFLFRPLHMAVLALKDILFRANPFASGAVNISLMAVAGFSLWRFASKLVSPGLALALAVLFMSQHASLEIVAWGHISPYLMSLAFFGFALSEVLKATPENRAPLTRAGAFLLAGALFHEAVFMALVLALLALLYARWHGGKSATAGGIPTGAYIARAIAFPLIVHTCLNLFDFIYHGMPLFSETIAGLSEAARSAWAPFAFPGASAVAFAAPFMVGLTYVKQDILHWNLGGILPLITITGVAVTTAALCGYILYARAMRKPSGSPLRPASLLAASMLLGLIIGVGVGRAALRDVSYLYSATYYYSMTAYAFCLLAAVGLHRLSESSLPARFKRLALGGVFAVLVLLIAINFVKTQKTLEKSWPPRRDYARAMLDLGRQLEKHSGEYCLAGSDGSVSMDTYSLLLRDYFCRPDDARTPGYLTAGKDGNLWISELGKHPFNPEVAGVEMVLRSGNFLLSYETFEKPDLSLKMKPGFKSGIVLGYKDHGNYLLFLIEGPMVSAHTMSDGRMTTSMERGVIPWVQAAQVEVRHFDGDVYLFVDGYIMAVIRNAKERAGRVGIFLWETEQHGVSYSDFVAARPGGGIVFRPAARLEYPAEALRKTAAELL